MTTPSLPPALDELYQLSLWRNTLFSAAKVHGIVFGVGCVPEIPMPEKWLGYVFAQHAKVPTEAALEQLTKALMDTLSQVLSGIHQGDYTFVQHWSFTTEDIEASSATIPVYSEFLQGVLLTHQAQEAQWQRAWNDMPESDQITHSKTLNHCLAMMSTFADVPLAISKKSEDKRTAFINALPKVFLSLPNAIEEYVTLSGTLAGYLPNQFEQFTDL